MLILMLALMLILKNGYFLMLYSLIQVVIVSCFDYIVS
jgi:hypothetical protein